MRRGGAPYRGPAATANTLASASIISSSEYFKGSFTDSTSPFIVRSPSAAR